jgi:carboxymethylenebutenolidase
VLAVSFANGLGSTPSVIEFLVALSVISRSFFMRLQAADGHEFDTYVATASTPAKAAIVIVQEIFGVNGHIRSVADDYASQGFFAIAPALFDRVERNLQLGYGPEDRKKGMQAATQVGLEAALKDVDATIRHAVEKLGDKKVGVVGFCWGGTLAWLAATRLQPWAAVGYYGGQIAKYAAEKPACPVMLHFGEKDAHIPISEIDTIRQPHPSIPVFLYDAGHGFNCDQRESYEQLSAALARQRTLEFLHQHLLTPHP